MELKLNISYNEIQNITLTVDEVFNEMASFYNALYPDIYKADQRLGGKLDYLIKDNIKKDSSKIKILDLGSGTGIGLKFLAEKKYDITLVDFSEEMLLRAKNFILKENKSLKVNFIISSYSQFCDTLGDKKYDVIFARGNSFDYIFDKTENDSIFKLLSECLNISGVLYCSGRNWLKTIEEKGNSFIANNEVNKDYPYVIHYCLSQLDETTLVNKISFILVNKSNIIETKNFILPIHPFNYNKLIKYLASFNITLIDEPINYEGIGSDYYQAYLFKKEG